MNKFRIAVVAVLVVVAWLAGFLPEYRARHEAQAERAQLTARAAAAEGRLRMADLLGQSLALADLAQSERFEEARRLSSAFFDAVRTESGSSSDPGFREALGEVLAARDGVTAALSRSEPEARALVVHLQARLRSALGFAVPTSVPTPSPSSPIGASAAEPDQPPPAPELPELPEPVAPGEQPTPTPEP